MLCHTFRLFHAKDKWGFISHTMAECHKALEKWIKWLFGHNKGKLQLWSQLNNMPARYAIHIVELENTSSKCQTIADVTLPTW